MIAYDSPKQNLIRDNLLAAERFTALGMHASTEYFKHLVARVEADRAYTVLTYRAGGEEVSFVRETTLYTSYHDMEHMYAIKCTVTRGNHTNVYRETCSVEGTPKLDTILMNILQKYTPLKTAITACGCSALMAAQEYEERKLLAAILEFHLVIPQAFAELHEVCVKDLFDAYNLIFVPKEVL